MSTPSDSPPRKYLTEDLALLAVSTSLTGAAVAFQSMHGSEASWLYNFYHPTSLICAAITGYALVCSSVVPRTILGLCVCSFGLFTALTKMTQTEVANYTWMLFALFIACFFVLLTAFRDIETEARGAIKPAKTEGLYGSAKHGIRTYLQENGIVGGLIGGVIIGGMATAYLFAASMFLIGCLSFGVYIIGSLDRLASTSQLGLIVFTSTVVLILSTTWFKAQRRTFYFIAVYLGVGIAYGSMTAGTSQPRQIAAGPSVITPPLVPTPPDSTATNVQQPATVSQAQTAGQEISPQSTSSLLTQDSTQPGLDGTVIIRSAPFRSFPIKNAEVTGHLEMGRKVKVTGQCNGYFQAYDEESDGVEGWTPKWAVALDNPNDDKVPVLYGGAIAAPRSLLKPANTQEPGSPLTYASHIAPIVDPACFTIGSDELTVKNVQGTPTSIDGNMWSYGFSTVQFENGLVVGYNSTSKNLHVAMQPPPGLVRSAFTIGSTKDVVLAAQGTPSAVDGNLWSYGFSTVEFGASVVVGYSDTSHDLHVVVKPSRLGGADTFGIGSGEDDVLSVQGTPTGIEGEMWSYDFSTIQFANHKVTGYNNTSNNLHTR